MHLRRQTEKQQGPRERGVKRASARLGGSELQGSSALLLDLVGIPEFLAAVVIVLFMLCPCHHPTTPSYDRSSHLS